MCGYTAYIFKYDFIERKKLVEKRSWIILRKPNNGIAQKEATFSFCIFFFFLSHFRLCCDCFWDFSSSFTNKIKITFRRKAKYRYCVCVCVAFVFCDFNFIFIIIQTITTTQTILQAKMLSNNIGNSNKNNNIGVGREELFV